MSDEKNVDALVIEVTINAYTQRGDGRVIGNNVADATVGFAVRTDAAPEDVSDERVMRVLARQLAAAVAFITDAFDHQGYTALGQVRDPIAGHANPTGVVVKAPPVGIVHPAPGDSGRPV